MVNLQTDKAVSKYLVEDNPLDVADEVCSPVEHRSEDLRGHDEAGSLRVDGNVARDETHVSKPSLTVSEKKKRVTTAAQAQESNNNRNDVDRSSAIEGSRLRTMFSVSHVTKTKYCTYKKERRATRTTSISHGRAKFVLSVVPGSNEYDTRLLSYLPATHIRWPCFFTRIPRFLRLQTPGMPSLRPRVCHLNRRRG